MDDNRYVVSIRRAGLGDRLICLCAAWRFARNTRRILLADWRHSRYAPSPGANLFPLCFEPSQDLAGVSFVGDNTVATIILPSPRFPAIWEDEMLRQLPFLRPEATLLQNRDDAVALIRSGTDVSAPTVVFDGCINDGVMSWAEARTFFEALHPVADAVDQVSIFRNSHLLPWPTIGLHIRHGNGGDIMGHSPFWDSFDNAIARCRAAIERARASLGQDSVVLLCTDSIDVQRAICESIPGVVCRSKIFREPGSGELHRWRDASLGRDDALIEMLLLAECDVLIRYPPGSFFSFYAAVMKRSRLPRPETLYDLQLAYDPRDQLSPALLL